MIYTIDNPKEIEHFLNPEEPNFTGVAKDKKDIVAYYLNGLRHRENGPAMIFPNGDFIYYQFGEKHNENGYAAKLGDSYYYCFKGEDLYGDFEAMKKYVVMRNSEPIYTIDNPKIVSHASSSPYKNFSGVVKDKKNTITYYINGLRHREDGPAVIYEDGQIVYYKNGVPHRIDGATVIYANGDKVYSIDGIKIDVSSDEEFERYVKLRIFE